MQTQQQQKLSLFDLPAAPLATIDFHLPSELEAGQPPEARGLARDAVRLMVSYRAENRIEHTTFRQLPDFLEQGDVVVINTSATMNAALQASQPFYQATSGETLTLPGNASVTLHTPYRADQRAGTGHQVRLWLATLNLPAPVQDYLAQYGFPIRYGYVEKAWPLEYYQTVYATEPGSAEMPSAGRAFTPELITRLVAKGVQITPLVLHTGVASLEDHEPPYEEFYRVPVETARLVNSARVAGKRVVAVGTTVVRALETVAGIDGRVYPGEGWTRLVITPDRPMRAVNALLTGLHEPQATHLAMLLSLAGQEHIATSYAAALAKGYLWHEFGDLHLILGGGDRGTAER